MADSRIPITAEDVTDPAELERSRIRRARFDRNSTWFRAHAPQVFAKHRGKFLCVAGEELFVGATLKEVLALAASAHPDDDGRFVHYIPREKVARVYAHRR
jgi:hypothetical protein